MLVLLLSVPPLGLELPEGRNYDLMVKHRH